MSRGGGHRSDSNGDAFPFWDEPEGRRRRGKRHSDKHRKSDDVGRSRRPRYDDNDWDDDYDRSDWDSVDLDDDLNLADDLADDLVDGDWDGDSDWDQDSDEGADDWRSRDDG